MDKQRGFTLIELVVVIGIIATLSTIGIPTYQNYLRRAALTDLLQAFVSCRAVIGLCALDYSGLAVYGGNSNGVPSSTTTRYLSVMSVAKGIITLTGQGNLGGLDIILTLTWDNIEGVTG